MHHGIDNQHTNGIAVTSEYANCILFSQLRILLSPPIRLFHRIFLLILFYFLQYDLIHIQITRICHQNTVIQYICQFFPDLILFTFALDIFCTPLKGFQKLRCLQTNGYSQIFRIMELSPVLSRILSTFKSCYIQLN